MTHEQKRPAGRPGPARRVAGIGPSPIRIISDGAKPGTIPLGLGEPGWDIPEPARRALAEVRGQLGYGPNAGIVELRDALAAFHGATRDEVLVVAGSQEGLFALLHGWVDPGDEVLVPDPGFPAYPTLTNLCGGVPVPYPLAAANRYRLDPAAVVKAIESRPKVRAVIINQPSNPTGGSASSADLRTVAEACEAHGVLLISDEVYRDLYLGSRGPSLRDVTKGGAVVNSASKGFGSPGLRLGWVVAEPRWLDPARTMHAYAVTSAAIPSQLATLALLKNADSVFSAARAELRVRWDALASACREHLGITIEPPDGGFYLWTPLPARAIPDPVAFAVKLRDEMGVVIIPGLAFGEGGRRHARISFAAKPDLIAEGIRRLAPHWK